MPGHPAQTPSSLLSQVWKRPQSLRLDPDPFLSCSTSSVLFWCFYSSDQRGWQDEMVAWHHWLNGREFRQAPGDGEGHGNLACCSPWGRKESDTTERLNNSNGSALSTGSLLSVFSKFFSWSSFPFLSPSSASLLPPTARACPKSPVWMPFTLQPESSLSVRSPAVSASSSRPFLSLVCLETASVGQPPFSEGLLLRFELRAPAAALSSSALPLLYPLSIDTEGLGIKLSSEA